MTSSPEAWSRWTHSCQMPTSIPTRLEQLWLREGFLAEVKLVLRLTASAVTSAGQSRARGASWEGQMLMLSRIKEPVYCCTVQISLHLPRCIDLQHNTPTFCVSSLSLSLSITWLLYACQKLCTPPLMPPSCCSPPIWHAELVAVGRQEQHTKGHFHFACEKFN